MNILILGHGYMAHALAREIASRSRHHLNDNKTPCDKLNVNLLCQMMTGVELVINAAAYIPPSGRVVHCDDHKSETILGNVVFPKTLADVCALFDVPMVHISTGCLFDEAKEYEETDAPTRGWDGYCGTYVGTKILSEKLVLEYPKSYVLRVRLPFDEIDHSRNYLSKLASFATVFDHVNSLTHRGDFAKAAMDLVELQAPFGIYNCVNPGQLSVRQIIVGMQMRSIIDKCPKIEENPPVAGTRLSTSKLSSVGVTVRHVERAMEHALDNWRKA